MTATIRQRRKTCELQSSVGVMTGGGDPDKEEMDRRALAAIQGQIEARRSARNGPPNDPTIKSIQ